MLFWPNALVLVRTTFCATAPAPLMATPVVPPKPADNDAAEETTLIVFFETFRSEPLFSSR